MIEITIKLVLQERGSSGEPVDMTVSSTTEGFLFGAHGGPLAADLQGFLAGMAASWMKQSFGDAVAVKEVEDPEAPRIITIN